MDMTGTIAETGADASPPPPPQAVTDSMASIRAVVDAVVESHAPTVPAEQLLMSIPLP
jgi:hypothetical protein